MRARASRRRCFSGAPGWRSALGKRAVQPRLPRPRAGARRRTRAATSRDGAGRSPRVGQGSSSRPCFLCNLGLMLEAAGNEEAAATTERAVAIAQELGDQPLRGADPCLPWVACTRGNGSFDGARAMPRHAARLLDALADRGSQALLVQRGRTRASLGATRASPGAARAQAQAFADECARRRPDSGPFERRDDRPPARAAAGAPNALSGPGRPEPAPIDDLEIGNDAGLQHALCVDPFDVERIQPRGASRPARRPAVASGGSGRRIDLPEKSGQRDRWPRQR